MRDKSIQPSAVEPTHEHLNVLLGYAKYTIGWTTRRASKDHVDLFGVPISAGDTYYALDYGFTGVDRLADSSMESLLRIVFRKPSAWLEPTELALRKQDDEMFAALNHVSRE